MVYFRYTVSNLSRKQIVLLSFLSVCYDDRKQANKFSCKLFKENFRKHLAFEERIFGCFFSCSLQERKQAKRIFHAMGWQTCNTENLLFL